jgi:hypothetical protein
VWVIPSRSRPGNIRRLIKACRDTGMTTPARIRVDEDDPCLGSYVALDVPGGWEICIGKCEGLSAAYNEALSRTEDWFGIICDDVVPETPAWDVRLIEAAGKDGLAYGDDGINGAARATHFAVGGDLVREVGWLALPGLDRVYIDTAWNDVARAKGVLRYLPDVKLTHLHFSNGKALMDATYRKPSAGTDRQIYEEWKGTR